MMISKTFKLIVLFTLMTTSSLLGQSSKYFKKNYGDSLPMYEDGLFIQVLSDGYLTGGGKFFQTQIERAYYVIKVNEFGDVIHEKTNIDTSITYVIHSAVSNGATWTFAGLGKVNTDIKYKHFVMKMDSSSNILWAKFVGDSTFSSRSYSIGNTLDGGYILGGYSLDTAINYSRGALMKLDSLGNEQWTRIYPSLVANNVIYHVEQNPDSTFTFVGGKDLWVSNGDMWIVHTDENGFEVSSQIYEFVTVLNSDYNVALHFTKTADNGHIISGSTGFLNLCRGIIFKIDSTGQVVWEKIMAQFPDGSGNPWQSDIVKSVILPDQSIVSAGLITVNANGNMQSRALLIKLDSTGNELWRRLFAYNNQANTYGYAMEATPDGGFIIAGRGEGPNIGADLYLIKTNCLGFTQEPKANFSVIWNGNMATFYNLSGRADTCIYYFGDGDSAIVHLTDTIPVVHTYSGPGPYQPYLLAFACGEIDTLYQTIYSGLDDTKSLIEKSFSIYPNPANDKLNISITLPESFKNVNLLFTDLTGRTIVIRKLNENAREQEIDISFLMSGSYLVSVEHNGAVLSTRRMAVVKTGM